jgi:hypothetical protein
MDKVGTVNPNALSLRKEELNFETEQRRKGLPLSAQMKIRRTEAD